MTANILKRFCDVALPLARIALFAGMIAGVAAAGAAAAPRVVLAVDGVGQTRNLPVLVAQQLGYFKREGLIVTLVDAPAAPSPADLLRDGRADGAVAFYHHTFMSQANDHLITQDVVTLAVTPALKLMVASRLQGEVRQIAELKGRRIFTGGENSGKTTAANWLAERGGFGIGGYQPLPLLSRGEMASALSSGAADAVMSHEPDAAYYAKSGTAFMLVDLTSRRGVEAALGDLYPATSLYFPKAYVQAHPRIVQHLVDACLKATAFIRTHSAEEILAALPPKTEGKDRPAYLAALAEDKKMFDGDGRLPLGGAGQELKMMAALNPVYRKVDLAQTYTDVFVDHALKRSGSGAKRLSHPR